MSDESFEGIYDRCRGNLSAKVAVLDAHLAETAAAAVLLSKAMSRLELYAFPSRNFVRLRSAIDWGIDLK